MLLYRTWRVEDTALLSPYATHAWLASGNRAVCLKDLKGLYLPLSVRHVLPPCVDSPVPDCTCGFYGYTTMQRALEHLVVDSKSNCIGIISAYGRRCKHSDGVVRTQYADVVALAVSRSVDLKFWGYSTKTIRLTPEDTSRVGDALSVATAWFPDTEYALLWLEERAAIFRASHAEYEPVLASLLDDVEDLA